MSDDFKLPPHFEKYIESLVAKRVNMALRARTDAQMTPEQQAWSENNKEIWRKLKGDIDAKLLTSVIYSKPDIQQLWAETGNTTPPSIPQQSIGWSTSTPPNSYFFNYLQQLVEQYLLHINQQGICVWDNATDYPVSALSKGSDGYIYQGLTTPNVGNDPVTDGGTNWRVVLSTAPLNGQVGSLIYMASNDAVPDGLECLGTAVSRTTYATLFASIGTTWGAGNGTTTFNLPNLSRRVCVGAGGSGTGTLGNTLGSTGGSETHAMTAAENGPHTHTATADMGLRGGGSGGSFTAYTNDLENDSPPIAVSVSGSGTPHNIMQPSAVVRVYIKYR